MNNFVVFSDLHLHQWAYGSTIVDGRNSRLQQQGQVVKDIVKYCVERDISEVVFCGDLFHSSTVTAEVSQVAYKSFSKFKENKINLKILVGNHDQANKAGDIMALEPFRELGRVFAANRDEIFTGTVGSLPSTFLPFTDDKTRLQSWLSNFKGGLLFLHQGVGGVEVNSKGFTLNEILTPEMIPDSCAMAFTGHYHSNKQVSNNLIIPGSTMQHNWGDSGEVRGWLDVSVDGEVVHDVQLIPSNSSKFITVDEKLIGGRESPSLDDNFVRVMSNGDYSPEDITKICFECGAASVEIKRTVPENKLTKIETTLPSFNEMVLAYATAKERAGVISIYDKEIGEALLKNNYHLPSI